MEETADKQRVTLFLDPEVVKKAKIKSIEDNVSLSELVERALNEYYSTK